MPKKLVYRLESGVTETTPSVGMPLDRRTSSAAFTLSLGTEMAISHPVRTWGGGASALVSKPSLLRTCSAFIASLKNSKRKRDLEKSFVSGWLGRELLDKTATS
jgi:hypothetical protein